MDQADVDVRFRDVLDALPAHLRVARSAAMFDWARGMIGRDILARSGPLSAERLKWETALRLCGSDPSAGLLIQRLLDEIRDEADEISG